MRTMTSVEGQNHFGMLLDSAQREPVSITRRGRPVAYMFSPQEYEALTQRKKLLTHKPLLNCWRHSVAAAREVPQCDWWQNVLLT
jgi:prevent-host-death family protein